ncbi:MULTISPECIES: superoxide dismutase family protein [Thermomonospora]|uniref:Uncharacterized protein n=1 Tax=Thermomonospora curvata (strain ATCC 19995 / DSM 43183 / JCM 3096 / KCTC 9072 / NBRC 15933 / NCIMB 10081 / Henssen B9) TaxID=471852 RepID=D1A997_THECD|nr:MULTISPECIES: superoxide dismutase family protein [Thermomonospora]ACY96793.1 hypothetical protein Tcur_1210 [Thermomonospora curvata DSM 43183]PKK15333.1 MAG: hypothetical protein BUE48_005890 [Thermomonospora sp. CIF 1]
MSLLRHTAFITAMAGAMTGAVAAPVAPALADPGDRVVSRVRAIEVTGPTKVYHRSWRGIRTTVQTGELAGGTWVGIAASGFPASAVGKRFGVHVHVNACGRTPASSGPHYQSPRVPRRAPLMAREIWLDLTVGPDRTARAMALRSWRIPKGAAKSVVIHSKETDPQTGDAGDRLVCTTVPFGDLGRR